MGSTTFVEWYLPGLDRLDQLSTIRSPLEEDKGLAGPVPWVPKVRYTHPPVGAPHLDII